MDAARRVCNRLGEGLAKRFDWCVEKWSSHLAHNQENAGSSPAAPTFLTASEDLLFLRPSGHGAFWASVLRLQSGQESSRLGGVPHLEFCSNCCRRAFLIVQSANWYAAALNKRKWWFESILHSLPGGIALWLVVAAVL